MPFTVEPLAAQSFRPSWPREGTIPSVYGDTAGLMPAELRMLERLFRRRTPPGSIITPEAARALTEASASIGRQVGLIIDRSGTDRHVLVGSSRSILIPDLSDYRLGSPCLRGVRFIHTHLTDQPLNQEALKEGKISEGHGRALLALPNPQAQNALLPTVINHELNVRQTEELVRKLTVAARGHSFAECHHGMPTDNLETIRPEAEHRLREWGLA